ncbi:phosphatidate cytidylyltransferase, mitochondrial [Euwallacea fornicatus]|uniref:phosphatidate cytidylyltransferase, mitochondrial n=1 Tax=Euwallacea fornicatus TaxID=995702 RepID=UPI00338E3731
MSLTKITIVPPIYQRIMAKFPQNFTFGFAYGSGVKKQFNSDGKENMIDLIFAVKDPIAWHEANLHMNSSHYSGLKYFGHDFISRYQRNFGAKVYFNTLVHIDDSLVKYGVVATEDIITDLLEWSDLYLAGRLHKPVEIIKKPLDSELETALQLNLQSAVHAALLTLPESFSEYEFYHSICNLSYLGDFRMVFGENRNKVDNIVKAQIPGFRNLYKPFLLHLHDYVDFPVLKLDDKKTAGNSDLVEYCAQDISPLAKLHHLNQLPRWPQKLLTRYWNKGNFRQDTEDVLRAIAYDPDCSTIVSQRINEIVWNSSVSQSLKSIFTAGMVKSIKYSSRKIKKMVL